MRRPPLQAPLLWQIYFGFWVAGVAAAVWFWPALCCALLLALADRRLWRAARLTLAGTLFLTALAVALWQLAPPWLVQSAPPAWTATAEGTAPPRLCGRVRDVQGLPDQRLRLLLADVRPQGANAAQALPGLTAWTWEEPLFRPLAGQTVCLSRRLRTAQGFSNTGLADWEIWWAARGVRWRLWSKGGRGEPEFSGQGATAARWREDLRAAFVAALLPAGPTDSETAFPLPQSKAILLALLFGDRHYLDQHTLDTFAAATLAHSLALSGQHLAVAGLLGLLCVLAAARLRPHLYLARPRAVLALAAACPPALAYLWLGNAPASLLRAVCMLFVLAFWLARGRARTTLDVLCAALLCICVAAPLSVLDTGLQLSALCVTVIGLALPWLRRITPRAARDSRRQAALHLVRWPLRILLLSLLIQVVLLPLNLLLFGNAGFWFPLNVLWLPMADLIVLPGAALGLLLAGVGLEEAARLTLNLAALPCAWLLDGLEFLNGRGLLHNPALLRPHWTALPAFAALAAGLACLTRKDEQGARHGQTAGDSTAQRGRRFLLAGLALLCVGPLLRLEQRFSDEIRLDVLDVGQGQALALRLPGHLRLVLDGGGSASPRFDPGEALVGPALTSNDAPRLTAVINSHPDLDHLGGLLHLLEGFATRALFHNGREAAGQLGERWRQALHARSGAALAEGDMLTVGDAALGLRLEVLHPPREGAHPRPMSLKTEFFRRNDGNAAVEMEKFQKQNGLKTAWTGNEASLILRLTRHGQGLALFTGDAERRSLRRLLASGRDLRAQVLVAPHHGSDHSFLTAFYKAVQPELVLVSCGLQNRYNYPGKRLRAWLTDNGIPLLHTGQCGQISVVWPTEGPLRVRTNRGAFLPAAFSSTR